MQKVLTDYAMSCYDTQQGGQDVGRKKATLKGVIGVPSIDILLPMLEYLDIDIVEYSLCFLIDRLAHNSKNRTGWCYASKEYLAEQLRCGRRTIFRAIDRLVDKDLIQRQEGTGNLTITNKWMEALEHFSQRRKDYVKDNAS